MDVAENLGAAEDAIINNENVAAGNVPFQQGDFQMPTREELLEMLDKLNMTDDEKDGLKEGIMSNMFQKPQDPSGAGEYIQTTRILIVVCCIMVMVLIFGKNFMYFFESLIYNNNNNSSPLFSLK